MKKALLFSTFTLCIYFLQAQTLVAYYPFNGNANDVSGNGHNATTTNATLTTDRFGNANSAYQFDGTSNYIQIPDAADLRFSGPFTINAWVQPAGFYSGSCQGNTMVNKGSYLSQDAYHLGYGDNLLDGGNCNAFDPNKETFFISYAKGGVEVAPYDPAIVQLNKWYMLTAVYDGTNLKIYTNGILKSTVAGPTGAGASNTDPLLFGKYFDGTRPYWLNGKLDDIKLYSGALSDAQIFDNYLSDLKKPGSGNALLFDNTNSQYVDIGTGWDASASFSFETWVKRTSTAVTDPNSQTFIGSVNNGGWGIGIYQSGGPLNNLYLTKTGISNVGSTNSAINDTKWHHVAVTYDAVSNQVIFYLDGVADGPYSYNPGGFNSSNSNYRLGGRNNNPNFNYLNGSMDEVRIWDGVVLTQTQIRDWMCRKITSTHPAYNNLKGYYRFDEGSGAATYSIGGHPGSLINSPAWVTSGAALGDASAHDYLNATKTATINALTGESFTATNTSGSPDGIQLYRVDDIPNTVSGANSGGNNKYFGVFQINGTAPQYTAVYNYNGNPLVTSNNENSLRLFKRADNSVTTWTDCNATLNTGAKTLTATGQSTEYILGSSASPLPVTLISFNAVKQNSAVHLSWITANEIAFDHFEVERSADGRSYASFQTTPAKGGSNDNNYETTDNIPAKGRNYYRLKMIDRDGQFKYSQVIVIDFSGNSFASVYPNPARSSISIYTDKIVSKIQIIDVAGKTVKQFTASPDNKYNIEDLERGSYFIRLINKPEIITVKFNKL